MNKAYYDAILADASPVEKALLDLLLSLEGRIVKIEAAIRDADDDAPTYHGNPL